MKSLATQKPQTALGLFGRYCLAIIVACVAWCVAACLAIGIQFLLEGVVPYGLTVKILAYVLFPLIGFSGVFLGSLCLHRFNRRLGSSLVASVGIVLAYIVYFMLVSFTRPDGPEDFPISFFSPSGMFYPLLIGGLVAVVFFFVRNRPNTPTPPSPSPPSPTIEPLEPRRFL